MLFSMFLPAPIATLSPIFACISIIDSLFSSIFTLFYFAFDIC